MALTCPSCGQDNPEAAKFCLECGSRLFREASGAQARKTITIVFSDLVGSTALAEGLDTEILTSVMSRYFDRMRGVLWRHGGTVEKFIGDAVVAVFGYPAVHEDDALRAVRAAEEMQSELQELNAELVDQVGVTLQTRTGVNTGEVLVGALDPGSNFAAGDVMNTGARLQQLAAPGEILLGEATWHLVRDAVKAEPMEPALVKGKAEPVPSWRLVKVLPGADAILRQLDSTLVGRQIELGLLAGSYQKAVQESAVQFVTVVGEPGLGKTRLVHELRQLVMSELGSPVRWRLGRCPSYGEGVTFWALGEIVKSEAGIMETDSADAASAKIMGAVPDSHPEAAWLRQRLRPLVGLPAPQAGREENFAAWQAFLEVLAAAGPLVLVFEDLHWADDALLAFLERVAGSARQVPLFLVGTARPELFERASTWPPEGPNRRRIDLAPLTEPETVRLVSNLLNEALLPAEVEQALLLRSGGNPLYAEQFVRLLRDRAILSKQGSTWTIDPEAEIPLPAGVWGIIAARLDTLPLTGKTLLQDAAVVGHVFWSEAVAAVAQRDPSAVEEELRQLRERELVRPTKPSSMEGQSEYVFSHALVRDVCYSLIPRLRRGERHRRAAAWIELTSGPRMGDHAEVLVAHFSTALELAAAAKDPDAAELEAKLVDYLVLAGDRAMDMGVKVAERHFARALSLTTTEHPRRPEILARHGEALRQRGRLAMAAQAYEEAIDGFRVQGDARAIGVAMSSQGAVLGWMGDSRYLAVLAGALAELEPLGPSRELLDALTENAGGSFYAGEQHQAIVFADQAISLAADLGMPEPPRALGFRGIARTLIGDAGGVQDLRRALDASLALGLGREVAVLYNQLADALWPIEGPALRLEMMREGAAFATRRGIEHSVLGLSAGVAEALADLGAYDEAAILVAEILPRLEDAKAVIPVLTARTTLARILTRRGDLAGARPLAELSVQESRDLGDVESLVVAAAVAARIRLSMGDAIGASGLLSELEGTATARDAPHYSCLLTDTVATALAAGDPGLAARLPEGVQATYPLYDCALVTVRAMLSEHRSDPAEAAALFAESARLWDGFQMPWERGQALLGAGRCLLALGRGHEADEQLKQARDIFVSLEAAPAIAETEGLLERVKARSS